MMQALIAEIIFIPVLRKKFVHPGHRSRLVIERTIVHDLDTEALIDCQELRRGAVYLLFSLSRLHRPLEILMGYEIRQPDD